MALANRKNTRRIFQKTGNGSLKMEDDKIAKLSQSFASNVHIDAPETPDAAQAMIYALQGIEEDVEELHRYLNSPTLVATNITASSNISASGTIFTDTLSSPANNLSIPSDTVRITAGTAGDANLILESDTDNNDETDTPYMLFSQDGGAIQAIIGLTGEANKWPDGTTTLTGGLANALVIGTPVNVNNPNGALFFATDGQNSLEISNLGAVTIPRNTLYVGKSGTGADMYLRSNNSSKTIQWSKTYCDLNFYNNTALSFGTKTGPGQGNVNIAFNGTELRLAPSSTNYNNIFKLTKPGTGITRLDVEGSITGSAIKATSITSATADFSSNVVIDGNIELGHASDTTIARSAAGEVTIEGKKIVTENYVKHVLNCGWVGSTNARQYLPFGYGGTSYTTNPGGWSEFGAFIAPCNGTVDHVIIRSEAACGNSTVGIHIVGNGTEMPSFNPGTGISDTVNMSQDDTSYKFGSFDGQYASNLNVFTAGQIIVVSFDPTGYPADSIATMVLNLDWTNTL